MGTETKYLKKFLQYYRDEVKSPLYQIKKSFWENDNESLCIKNLSKKLNLPEKEIEKTIENEIFDMGSSSIFLKDQFRGETYYSLNAKIFKPNDKLEEISKAEIAKLSETKDFITAIDIFTKAIANVNRLPYEAAIELGVRCAHWYYFTQQYESVALIRDREETTFEKRIKFVDTKSNDPDIICAILRRLEAENDKEHIHFIENSINSDERQLIRDFLISKKLAQDDKLETTVLNGKEWRLYSYKINKQKLEHSTNPENVLFDEMKLNDSLSIIFRIMDGLCLDDTLDPDSKNYINKLKNQGLVNIEEQPYASYLDGDADKSLEEMTSKQLVKLSPKILKYSLQLVHKVFESASYISLEHALDKLNFEFTREDLKELDILSKRDLEEKVMREPIPTNTKLPVFFKIKARFPGGNQNKELICRLSDPEYERRLSVMDILAYLKKKKFDLGSESIWAAYISMLKKIDGISSTTNTHINKLRKKGRYYLQTIAAYGDPAVVKKYLAEVKAAKKSGQHIKFKHQDGVFLDQGLAEGVVKESAPKPIKKPTVQKSYTRPKLKPKKVLVQKQPRKKPAPVVSKDEILIKVSTPKRKRRVAEKAAIQVENNVSATQKKSEVETWENAKKDLELLRKKLKRLG